MAYVFPGFDPRKIIIFRRRISEHSFLTTTILQLSILYIIDLVLVTTMLIQKF